MLVDRIELREIRLSLIHPFETSFGRTTDRHIVLVRVSDLNGIEGWGECTVDWEPYYSEEWIGSAWSVMESHLLPLVRGGEFGSASEVDAAMDQVRGNRMAKAAIETACWDLDARLRSVPLWQLLGGSRTELGSGVSIGLQPTVEALLAGIQTELTAGYQRIKIKIKPGQDLHLVRAVRERFPDVPLMVDANSAYGLEDAPLFRELDKYNLMMIEQPLAHDDLADHARLQREINTPICLDESIRSAEDARHAIELGACRIINIKLGRVGGHSQARRVEQLCRDSGIPVWCGGMLEAGIGRAHNIAMSTLGGFVLPGDVSASQRYWREDIIDPPVTVTPHGTIIPTSGPGIGFRVKEDLIDRLTVRKLVAVARTAGVRPAVQPASGRLTIRELSTPDELRAVEDLQIEVWQCSEREVLPAIHMTAARAVGGILLGAFDGTNLVGFVYGFPGFEGEHRVIHSDMLAVRRENRDRGVGLALKLAQRDAALGRGITRITWTFDPLQSKNAHFNFVKLGVIADRYKPDFYGTTTSPLHRLGTDRLWVRWDLVPSPGSRVPGAPAARIEIPADIVQLPAEEALHWRDKVRREFTDAFERGLVATGFLRTPTGGAYLLERIQ